MTPHPNRRGFTTALVSAGACAMVTPHSGEGAEPDAESATRPERAGEGLRIGLIADAQYADVDTWANRHYRASTGKLREACLRLGGMDLAFVVHLGDFIDRDWASFDAVEDTVKDLRHPLHHLLGNHDYDVEDGRKADVPRRLGTPDRYREIRAGGVRILLVDTNDVSVYAFPADSPAAASARARLENLAATGAPQANPWNGAIGPAQLKWLDERLTEADGNAETAIILAHHPIAPLEGHCAWNAEEILTLLQRHPSFAAWINGHNHAGGYVERKGRHFLTLHGMVETSDTSAFSVLDIEPGARLTVTGFGREPSRVLSLRPSTRAGARGA